MLTRRFVTGLEIKVMSRPLFLEFTTTRGAVKLVSFDVKRTENNVQRCPKMFKDEVHEIDTWPIAMSC